MSLELTLKLALVIFAISIVMMIVEAIGMMSAPIMTSSTIVSAVNDPVIIHCPAINKTICIHDGHVYQANTK